jgi:hypothetical protein
VSTAQAISFAMAAQLLVLFAGAALIITFALWQARRWVPRRGFAAV